MSLALLDTVLVQEILSWLSLPDVSRLSITSHELNSVVSNSLNVHTPDGWGWWQDLLDRDYGTHDLMMLGDMLPNVKYMCYFGRVVDRVRFAVLYGYPEILDALGTNVNVPQLSIDDITDMLDMNYQRVDDVVWRAIRSNKTRLPVTNIAYSRPDLLEKLLSYPFMDTGVRYGATTDLINVYNLIPSQELLELLNKQLDNSEDSTSYIGYAIASQRPEILRQVLKRVPRDGKGKINTLVINRNQGQPLESAAKLGNTEIIRMLIEAGASPYTYKHAAFATAAKYNNVDAMKLLSKYLTKGNPAVVPWGVESKIGKAGKQLLDNLQKEGKAKYGTHISVK